VPERDAQDLLKKRRARSLAGVYSREVSASPGSGSREGGANKDTPGLTEDGCMRETVMESSVIRDARGGGERRLSLPEGSSMRK
jgi:hypothetical protein